MREALAVARKELRQVVRDGRTLMILLFIPAFFLLLYGYALSFDIRNVRLAVQDRDRTPQSREVIAAFVNSGYFDLAATPASPAAIERLLDRGDVKAVLVIPEGFGRRAAGGQGATVQILIDGENANTATTVMGYALRIVATVSAGYQVRHGVVPAAAPPVTPETRIWWNPELRSALFLVPGLIAYIMMLTAVVSTALSIVREKERGTMEQVRMAPLTTLSFVIGKTVPYFFISLASAVLVVLASMILFDVPMRGSWASLLLALSLFIAGALGTGLLVSTLADTQQVAFQVAVLAAFLPTLMLSGFIFPISSMPGFVQAFTYAVPARYFLEALRGILLKGLPVAAVATDLLALVAYAAIVLGLSSIRLAREWR
jgi:ABC-2 type transport system permease protein